MICKTYIGLVPSYDEDKDFLLDFELMLHDMIQQLFQQVDFSPIGLVALTELTCTRDISTLVVHRQFAKDMLGRNYAHRLPLF